MEKFIIQEIELIEMTPAKNYYQEDKDCCVSLIVKVLLFELADSPEGLLMGAEPIVNYLLSMLWELHHLQKFSEVSLQRSF